MKSFSTLIFCFCTTLAFGQDIIRLKDGEKVAAEVLDVNRHVVKFKRFDDQAGPTYLLSRRHIAELTYDDIVNESVFTRATKTREITQVTETPVRQIELFESKPVSTGGVLFYLRDCMATFRRVSLQAMLVR